MVTESVMIGLVQFDIFFCFVKNKYIKYVYKRKHNIPILTINI